MENTNLKTINDSDLIKEILSRYDYAVFTGIKKNDEELGTNKMVSTWTGHLLMLMGLTSNLMHELIMAQNPR